MPMKHLPNILSSLRIVGTVVLLLSDVSSILFGVLYIVCGISDIKKQYRSHGHSCDRDRLFVGY
jgi:CDP-diacylglycerol--glycerol-3-phosphate 3-phosphatidyltransferase